jgi:hypothetical protein
MESRLGEETVILHLGSGVYFGLDAVGTLVWEAIRGRTGARRRLIFAPCPGRLFDDAPDTVEDGCDGVSGAALAA